MLKWVEEAVQASKVHLLSTDHLSKAVNTWQIPFDPSLKEVTVSLSGPSPAMEIHNPLGKAFYTFFVIVKKGRKNPLWYFIFLYSKFVFFPLEETGKLPYSVHFISPPSSLLPFVTAFQIAGHFCLSSVFVFPGPSFKGCTWCLGFMWEKLNHGLAFLNCEDIQNQTCLSCPSPAELCVMGNAMTDLELICNWSYFEQICCLLLCWCVRNLEQHSRNKFRSYFVFSEWLLPEDIAWVAWKYFYAQDGFPATWSGLSCTEAFLFTGERFAQCLVQAMIIPSPGCKYQASAEAATPPVFGPSHRSAPCI